MRRAAFIAVAVLAGWNCLGCSRGSSAPLVNPTAPAPATTAAADNGPEETLADPNRLVDHPAPVFQTQQLDGSNFSLEQLRGKVVMLDFWATWCPPCLAELPVIMKLAEEYADRGAVLYAVNAGETPEEIQAFLIDKKWKLNALLDTEGTINKQFGVDGIPMLLLIDRAGVVRKVEVGYHPDVEQVLRRELDALTAQTPAAPPESSGGGAASSGGGAASSGGGAASSGGGAASS